MSIPHAFLFRIDMRYTALVKIKLISNPITCTERTTVFLMANLGSEMTRCLDLEKRRQREEAEKSAKRAFRIMDQLEVRPDIGTGKQEAAILRNILQDALSQAPKYRVSEQELATYFLPFARKVLAT